MHSPEGNREIKHKRTNRQLECLSPRKKDHAFVLRRGEEMELRQFRLLFINNPLLRTLFFVLGGYANEVGEAFRPQVHRRWVQASYGVACLYVAADTLDKTKKADAKEKAKPTYNRGKVVATALDTLIWQSLASVIIPGFTINRLCAFTLLSLNKFTKLAPSTKKWTTTAVGLGSIPFIVKPIDTLVDIMLDRLMRPFFGD